ncbi:MAG: DUF1800 family protein [Ilumatobacteraceae bacterium]
MTSADTRIAVAHLMRRAGFGAPAAQVDRIAAGGYLDAVDGLVAGLTERDAAADALPEPTFDTAGQLAARIGTQAEKQAARRQARREANDLVLWWLRRMAVAEQPLREKLTLIWHDHFATSIQKVKLPALMHAQRATLYDLGPGRFDRLLSAMVTDPAMLVWLDGVDNVAGTPNENFARELFELFTLGHGHAGHAGGQPYGEADVRAAARAFTGWKLDGDGTIARLRPRLHDAATKTVLGVTGPLGGDDVVRVATAQPACAPHVVSRLWSRIGRSAGPDDPTVMALAEPFAEDLDVAALLRRMFLHPDFLSARTRQGLVKTPIDLVVGIARTLDQQISAHHLTALQALGHVPFLPPDVAGWPADEGWLSTSSAQARLAHAVTTAAAADVAALGTADAAARVASTARLLGVEVWGRTSAATLSAVTDPHELLTLALVAPEHVMA